MSLVTERTPLLLPRYESFDITIYEDQESEESNSDNQRVTCCCCEMTAITASSIHFLVTAFLAVGSFTAISLVDRVKPLGSSILLPTMMTILFLSLYSCSKAATFHKEQ